MGKKTDCVHGNIGGIKLLDKSGAICVPIYQSATFEHIEFGKSTGFDYSRLSNPTRDAVQNTVALLEDPSGEAKSLAFSTGMAAISCVLELFSPGDHIIASEDLYGGAIRLFRNVNVKNGISVDFIDTSDLKGVKKLINKNTKAIFVESPTNPTMIVTDLAAVGRLCREAGALFIVDNTFLTPYLQQPFESGADVIVHSGTKYLAGHNDTLSGFVVTKNAALHEKLAFLYKTIGACLSPFDSYLVMRGIKTLALRMEAAQKNAKEIAEFLRTQPKIKKVYYPGTGAMLSFLCESRGLAVQILNKTKLIAYAESLGGVETLLTYPATQTHADIPEAERNARGITDAFLRLSTGIEDAEDLINDLKNAING